MSRASPGCVQGDTSGTSGSRPPAQAGNFHRFPICGAFRHRVMGCGTALGDRDCRYDLISEIIDNFLPEGSHRQTHSARCDYPVKYSKPPGRGAPRVPGPDQAQTRGRGASIAVAGFSVDTERDQGKTGIRACFSRPGLPRCLSRLLTLTLPATHARFRFRA